MRGHTRRLSTAFAVLALSGTALTALGPTSAEAASTWKATVTAGSSAQAHGGAAPSTPVPTATCTSSRSDSITLTWPAISRAGSYDVYYSTTPTGTYTYIETVTTNSVSGSTGGTGTYYFKVLATIGDNWDGALSAATAKRTTTSTSCS